jgi:nucleotide-binding universal stress UspA family protein
VAQLIWVNESTAVSIDDEPPNIGGRQETSMKVLLAVDGSVYTKRMLAYLAAHDEFLGTRCEYTVLTVVPTIPPHAARHVPSLDLKNYYQDEAEGVLAPVKSFVAQQGWKVEFQHRKGHPAEVVASVATEGKFDLLVLGSHGHSALGNLLLGSVTTRVLAHCTTPMLVVR